MDLGGRMAGLGIQIKRRYAGDMRSSHGGSIQGIGSGVTGVPCGHDSTAWCKNIYTTSDIGSGCSTGTGEHFDGMYGYILGNSKAQSAYRPRNMRAMPTAIIGHRIVINEIIAVTDSARKFRVGRSDACVDHVNMHTAAIINIRISLIKRQVALIDTIQSP
jgi:hypothetical protein